MLTLVMITCLTAATTSPGSHPKTGYGCNGFFLGRCDLFPFRLFCFGGEVCPCPDDGAEGGIFGSGLNGNPRDWEGEPYVVPSTIQPYSPPKGPEKPTDPVPPEMKKISQASEASACVIVKAPLDRSISINGVPLSRKSDSETFDTPPLQLGMNYSYTVVARVKRDGQEVSESRRVPITAGGRAEVDFTLMKGDNKASTVTILADRESVVRVNGSKVVVNGKQTFDTPLLSIGQSYFYTIETDTKKNGKTLTEKRKVDVVAGQVITVDLRSQTTVAGR